jgi:predicted Zn-dependent protease
MTIYRFSIIALLFVASFVFLAEPVSAKDEWLQVRSKNFFVIGNASEKDIRKAATKLEQFRETFRLLFGTLNLNGSVPTNVVVFKNDSAYTPFKPKRGDKIDSMIAGYFQSGEDVNYITLSAGGNDFETYSTIFHEYVHFIINTAYGRSQVPPWFNEGLAEYYETFEIEEDINVKLGLAPARHIATLRINQPLPFSTFFNLTNEALHKNGNHSRSIFYAQAWAFMHYVILNGKNAELNRFLALTMANKPTEEAFREAFGVDYPQMEKELRQYVMRYTYPYRSITLKNKLTFDAEMKAARLSEAETNAYLGDMLSRINREADAEPYLRTALTLEPALAMANATFGMIRIRQRKYDEAKGYLEKAISSNHDNHLAFYRYAYLLSRESRDDSGYVSGFETEVAAKMRDMLNKAIAINPAFTPSYELLAFVNLVNNEQLDESVRLLRTALKYQPGNMRYLVRVAEIYLRQGKLKEAGAIAAAVAKKTEDAELRTRSEQILINIRKREEISAQNEAARIRNQNSGYEQGEQILVRRRPGEEKPTAQQIAEAEKLARLRGINRSLLAVAPGEKRILGTITKIDCSKSGVLFSINTGSATLTFANKDFRSLPIITFVAETRNMEMSCSANFATSLAVLRYRPSPGSRPTDNGELRSIEFVPTDFRFIDLAVEPKSPTYVIEEIGPTVSGDGQSPENR